MGERNSWIAATENVDKKRHPELRILAKKFSPKLQKAVSSNPNIEHYD
jgi:hypothetical protein